MKLPPSYDQLIKPEEEESQTLSQDIKIFRNPPILFMHQPILTIIQQWLLDTDRYQKMIFNYQPKFRKNSTSRIYADIWDSNWMKEKVQKLAQKRILDPKIIPIIFWSDGASPAAFSKNECSSSYCFLWK
eukprot:TRINITY_DN6502_c0_g1_i1.p1 TRINITY_DN6502_c0_g1~~TRINITY_DN6502_c0_g1_i1.p1  ORF type:complete len:130 (+),score=28.38 TRINITY_DN6502_c0_g1_i1:369-758(+)